MTGSGSVRGKVTTSSGVAVPGATVVLAGGPGPAPDIAPLSDDTGSFALDGLTAGAYLLRAFGPAGESGETEVTVTAGGVTGASIVLRPPQAASRS